ncbi:hypothetical protein DRJ72_14190, partial [Enterococcus faecalis]
SDECALQTCGIFLYSKMNFAWNLKLNTTLIGVRSTRLKYILPPLNSKTLIYMSSSVGYTLQLKE